MEWCRFSPLTCLHRVKRISLSRCKPGDHTNRMVSVRRLRADGLRRRTAVEAQRVLHSQRCPANQCLMPVLCCSPNWANLGRRRDLAALSSRAFCRSHFRVRILGRATCRTSSEHC
jgi:hypothetical protein